jgi:predicted thioredoxin/glutaredoxin
MENTFWNISRDGNFLESFKESFTLYIDSGMRMKAEVEADILRNVEHESENLVTKDFEERFCKLITDHYLRKIHCFFKHSTLLTASFTLYSPLQVW